MAAYMEEGVITQVGSGDFIRGYIRQQQRSLTRSRKGGGGGEVNERLLGEGRVATDRQMALARSRVDHQNVACVAPKICYLFDIHFAAHISRGFA